MNTVIHTGQHYDAELSDVFFAGLGIPEPDFHLGVGSGSHGAQTGAMLAALDPCSTVSDPTGCSCTATPTRPSRRPGRGEAARPGRPPGGGPALLQPADARGTQPRAHRPRRRPAAGTDGDGHATPRGREPPSRSGSSGTSWWTCASVRAGVAIESRSAERVEALSESVDVHQPYVVGTLHRPDNTDQPARLAALVEALARTPVQVLLAPIHGWSPGPAARHRPRSGLDPALPPVGVRPDGGGAAGIRAG